MDENEITGCTYLYFQSGHFAADFLVMEIFLNINSTLNRFPYKEQLLLVIRGTRPWPHDNHGIADKLYYIASILAEAADHAVHVCIDNKCQLLIPSYAHAGANLRHNCEPGNICEQHHSFHLLKLWHLICLVEFSRELLNLLW